MLLGDGDSRSAVDDLRQARELALLICKSEDAITAFLSTAISLHATCCCRAAIS